MYTHISIYIENAPRKPPPLWNGGVYVGLLFIIFRTDFKDLGLIC